MKANLILSAMFAATALIAAPALAQTTQAVAGAPVATRALKVLPHDAGRWLKITRIPTSRPIPILVGVYWSCNDANNGSSICQLVTVACTDDQSQCVEL